MRAIAIAEFGGPEVLSEIEVDGPKVGPDTVLIRIAAAGVNPVDFKIRQGYLADAFPYDFPLIPGWDAAGTVAAVGPAVTAFAEGDEVYAYTRKTEIRWGAYAELVAVPESMVARKPATASMAEAGGLPLAALTAWQCLRALEVGQGQTVFVTAGAGGVGHFAVQLAHGIGAEVVTTASEANHEFVRSLGAAHAIDYRDGEVTAAVRGLYPAGVDAVLDLYGGDAQAQARATLREGGGIASIADPDPAKGDPVTGHYVFVRPSGEQLAELAALYDRGRLRTEVAEVYALGRARDAHERIEGGHVRGKLVLEPR